MQNIFEILRSILRFFIALIIVLASCVLPITAQTLSSSNFQLENGTFSAGGVVGGLSATYTLDGTYGEAIVGGDIVAIDFEEIAGFQAVVVGVPAIPAEEEEEEEVIITDGGSGASDGGDGAATAPSFEEPPSDIGEPPPVEEPAEPPVEEQPVPAEEEPLVPISEPSEEPIAPPAEDVPPLFPVTPDTIIPAGVQTVVNAVSQGFSQGIVAIQTGAARVLEVLEKQPIFQVAQNATKIVLDTTEKILQDPVADATSKTITTSVVVTIIGPQIAAASAAALADPAVFLFKLWGALLSLLGIKKRSKPWGTVYDSVTKQPLDPAYVLLTDGAGKEIATDITDLDGRFGFLLPLGTYYMTANKTHYEFPSKRLAGKNYDEVYSNLYFGGPLQVTGPYNALIQNIPMDSTGFDWNEFAKKDQKLMKFYSRHDLLIARITNIFFIIGSIIAILSAIVLPGPYNVIIAGTYGVVLLLRIVGPRQRAYGTASLRDGTPLSYAIVRVFNASNREILHTVCDKYGRYLALVPNGDYIFTIEKKTGEDTYENVYTSSSVSVRKGILKERVRIVV